MLKLVIPCRILNVCKRMMALGDVYLLSPIRVLFGRNILLSSCLHWYLLFSS